MPDIDRLFQKFDRVQARPDRRRRIIAGWWLIAGLTASAATGALTLSASAF
jgi:hypothetical protein